MDDSIVEEVRKAGKILSENCKNDVHLFADFIRAKEIESKNSGWKFISIDKIKSSMT